MFGGAGGTYGDAFLAELGPLDTAVYIKQPFVDTLFCAGQTFTVHDSVNFNFNGGNTFTVQLSNSSGSFASPTNIGSVTSSTTGNISVTIPGGTPVGSGYRIRIVSTSPADTSTNDGYDIRVFALTGPTLTNSGPVCLGDSIKFTAVNTAPVSVTYSWSGPSGFSSTQQNPYRTNATLGMTGTYTVTVSAPGCASANSNTGVTVNNTYPALPSAGSNSPICQGQTLNLNSASATSGVTYQWDGPNVFNSTSQNPSIINTPFGAGGTYYVRANLGGCWSPLDSTIVVVNPSLTPAITITANPANDSVCQGSVIAFTASTLNAGNNPTFQWMDNSQNVIGGLSNFYSSPFLGNGDTIICILTVANSSGCVSTNTVVSNPIVVTVMPTVTPLVTITPNTGTNIMLGTNVTFTNLLINGGSAPTYQWRINGVDISAPFGTASVFNTSALTDGDSVTLVVHSSEQCANPDSAVSASVIMHVSTTGINNRTAFNDVKLFPNPSNGNFTVQGLLNGVNGKDVSCEILNAVGQVVYSNVIAVQNNQLNQQISTNLADGVYMLRLDAEQQSKVFRLVVQH